MDIAALSTALSTTKVSNDVSVAMLKKSLDTLDTTGENMVKMMELSVNPNLGQNIDFSI